VSKNAAAHIRQEAFRKAGNAMLSSLDSYQTQELIIEDYTANNESKFFAEGMALGAYKFDKYKTSDKNTSKLSQVFIYNDSISPREIELLNISIEATFWSRNLLNEPQSVLNAQTISEEFVKMGKATGAKVEVLSKSKIVSLKMGGLLAVNLGSMIAPTFTIMEWKPENAINEQPYIFVGKGVVYDTGGVNIKTGEGMTNMHMDMGGAAAASTAFYAVAKAKLPVYVMAIIPATDNRPGQNAYTPGDIITMHNGKTVEILNTDAEGRMILADALSYAQRYNPSLVIDLATLTGAAARAIGKYGIVAMRNEEAEIAALNTSSLNVYERLVEFPMWEEYDELIKTEVADIKNIGGAEGGAITAGKFLQHFVNYPWIHLDIAGPAMLSSADSYRTKGGSGVGTRLLFDFIIQLAAKQ
jgi:leucyl aminopeptidase